jgi:hypothetical protein
MGFRRALVGYANTRNIAPSVKNTCESYKGYTCTVRAGARGFYKQTEQAEAALAGT